jgi:uncharacterized membrane protein YkvA (DUF1232 family)
MDLTPEQQKRAEKQFEKDIKKVDSDDVEYASKKGQKKVDEMDANPPGYLSELWEDLKLMVGMVTDYAKGNYTEVPWKVIAAVTGAVVYFVSPVDLIPDFIPVVGYLDDAYVIKLAIDFARDDLKTYAAWKKS